MLVVRDDRMVGFDVCCDAFFEDPHPTLAALRAQAPCHYEPRLDAHLVTRFHDVSRVLTDHQLFSSVRASQFGKGAPASVEPLRAEFNAEMSRLLVFTDPPLHGRLRSGLALAFGPSLAPLLQTAAKSTIAEALDELESSPEPDVIRDFAYPVPSRILARLLGIDPADIDRFKQWTTDVLALIGVPVGTDEVVRRGHAAILALREYILDLLRDRRARPRDDMLSKLAAIDTTSADAELTDGNVVGLCYAMILGGHESTTNLLGNSIQAILLDGDARAYVLDQRGRISADGVGELVRFDGPFLSVIRRALHDTTIADRPIRAGEFVFSMITAANRDPEAFSSPDRLDLAAPRRKHLGFGASIHSCIGISMARTIVQVSLEQFFTRYPDASTDAGRCRWQRNLSMRGLDAFPVDLGPRHG